MSKQRISIITVVLFLIVATINISANDSPFSFLRFNYGGRSAALSGACEAISGDINNLFFNPALIYDAEHGDAKITFSKHLLDINSGVIAYMLPINKKYGNFAISTGYTDYGSFEYLDNTGQADGRTFGANNLSFGITYANEIDTNFHYGITTKFIYAGIENASTSGLALDIGLVYNLPDERSNLALSILNAGFQLTEINGVSDKLPLDVRIGINHRLVGLPLLLNVSLHNLADSDVEFLDRLAYFSIGGEFYFGKYLRVRAGYNNQIRSLTETTTTQGLNGISAGFGIVTTKLLFDYGVNQYGSEAILHRIGIGINL